MIKINRLKEIKEIIELMPPCYQIDILKMLNEDSNVKLSENNNGVFINLSDLKINTVKNLENYIQYFEDQQFQLQNIENKKDIIKESFFNKNNETQFNKPNKEKSINNNKSLGVNAE